MQILWLKLKGYCRFKDEVTLNLSGKLVALLGSNETGKTSILTALSSLSDDKVIEPDKVYNTTDVDSDETHLKARFLLSDEEISQAQLNENSKLEVHKSNTKDRLLVIDPVPEFRDLSKRKSSHALLSKMLEGSSFLEVINSSSQPNLKNTLNQCNTTLSTPEESLNPSQLNQLKNSFTLLQDIETDNLSNADKEMIESLSETLSGLYDFESEPSKTEFAIQTLKTLIPSFIFFTQEDRDLKFEYPTQELSSPPKSLRTLATLADLDLPNLKKAMDADNSGRMTSLTDKANKELKGIFDGKWSQSPLEVKLIASKDNLRIFLAEGDDEYSELNRRSDGFKQFLALIAFANLKHSDNFNLLIDEIETHLHYDGQADLLQTLTKQDFVNKIIYSTHSVGCFPENLDSIKLIERVPEKFTSSIQNKFWINTSGLTPLLPKIGAEHLAFLPLRNAVIVEGATDMLLLPMIFKEVVEQDYLGFLIVHGLSEQDNKQVFSLGANGKDVQYLTDKDEAGKKIKADLIKNIVSSDQIFHLPELVPNSNVVLEDLLTSECLKSAFNSYQEKHLSKIKNNIGDIPEDSKSKYLEEYVKENKIKSYKVPLAYEILELKANNPNLKIVDQRYANGLKKLYDEIISGFNKIKE